jgi:hypothetical protein
MWMLCLVDKEGSYRKYSLVEKEPTPTSEALNMTDALVHAHSSEIELIPRLIQSTKTGLKLMNYSSSFEANFAVFDTERELYSRHFFKCIQPTPD